MSLYTFTLSSEILNSKLKNMQEKNPSFSIRAWAKQLGLSSHGPLQQALSGKRVLPKKYLPLIAKTLSLKDSEVLYLEALINFEKAKGRDEKLFFQKRLDRMRPARLRVKTLELEHYKYFENPLHAIVKTLVKRSDFEFNLTWIKSKLRFKTTHAELKSILNRLMKLGFIEKKGESLRNCSPKIINHVDTPSIEVQKFHQQMSKIAAEQVSIQDASSREFNSLCFNIDASRIQEAKLRLRELTNTFVREFENNSTTKPVTYHLNSQLFMLTEEL